MARSLARPPADRRDAARVGMLLALHAREDPGRPAVASPHGSRSFGELDARANRLVHALRARGVGPGDAIALVCSNRPEFAEAMYAALRGGLRITPINWHLTGREMAYIANDCEAKAILADRRFAGPSAEAAEDAPAARVRLAIGGGIPGFEPYEDALAGAPPEAPEDPSLGRAMLYTSGTTGHPKGVLRDPRAAGRAAAVIARYIGYRPGADTNLCTGPLYHAAPLAFSLTGPLNAGVGVVMMDGFDPEEALRRIERHRVTHTHMVPTMFHRLLALPEAVRRRYDTGSLRMVLHGAAPCPVATKQALMKWLGPVVYEYYAATEGWGCFATPDTWLERPGTVGRPEPGQVEIRGADGRPLPPGEPGAVYLRAPEEGRFVYYKDEAKTRRAYDERGAYFTLGDVGTLDAEGYLFLCDRSADVIISGGVNVYPAEVDAVLLEHPAVSDAATIGVPNDEWGEEVRAVVELADGRAAGPALAGELVEHCRRRLARYKCPRAVDFTDALPRSETGKIYRRLLREQYWEGRERRI